MSTPTPPKHGGRRNPPGGRPKKAPTEKRIKTAISMRPDQFIYTQGDRSQMIERALDHYLRIPEKKVTTITQQMNGDQGGPEGEGAAKVPPEGQ